MGPTTDVIKYKESSAINFSFYHRNSDLIIIENFISYGSKVGVRMQDTYRVNLLNSCISSENYVFYICGASLEINGGRYIVNTGPLAHIQSDNMLDTGGTNGSNYVDFSLLNATVSSSNQSSLINWVGNNSILRTWKVKDINVIAGVMNTLNAMTGGSKDIDSILKRQFGVVKSATYDNSPNQFAVVLKVSGLIMDAKYDYSYNQMIGPEGVRTAIHWGGTIQESEVRLYGSDTSTLYKVGMLLVFYTNGY
jgi:hypothetical protein